MSQLEESINTCAIKQTLPVHAVGCCLLRKRPKQKNNAATVELTITLLKIYILDQHYRMKFVQFNFVYLWLSSAASSWSIAIPARQLAEIQ